MKINRRILCFLTAVFLFVLFIYSIYPLVLAIRFDYKGEPYTLARYIAYKKNYVFKDRRVLNTEDSKGCSLAYIYTMSGLPINYDKSMLLKPTCTGSILAYYVGAMGFKLPEDYEIVSKMGLDGSPIAISAVNMAKQMFSDPRIQQISNRRNLKVIFFMAGNGYGNININNKALMRHGNDIGSGVTIAHHMARFGHEFYDPQTLQLSNKNGITVAHVMAVCQKYVFKNADILQMRTQKGLTVEEAVKISVDCKANLRWFKEL